NREGVRGQYGHAAPDAGLVRLLRHATARRRNRRKALRTVPTAIRTREGRLVSDPENRRRLPLILPAFRRHAYRGNIPFPICRGAPGCRDRHWPWSERLSHTDPSPSASALRRVQRGRVLAPL